MSVPSQSRTSPASSQRARLSWTALISSTGARRRRLYCDCESRWGNQPGNTRPTSPRNWRSAGPSRDRVLIGEDVRCNDKGFQIGRHLEPPSRGTRLEALLRTLSAGPCRDPPFHIKPLGRGEDFGVVVLGDTGERRLQHAECVLLELADALAREAELLADRLERLRLAVEPEAELDDPALALRQILDRATHGLAPVRRGRLLDRIARGRVVEQIAELSVVLVADPLVQRDVRLGRVERLVHVQEREAGCLGELLACRVAAKLRLQLVPLARDLHAPLVPMAW